MRIVINTNAKNLASSKILLDQIGPWLSRLGHEVAYNDWDNYLKYEIVLFLAPDSEVLKAKKQNPKALVGIIDPKTIEGKIEEIKQADFLLPTSIEQRDFFLKFNQNSLVFPYLPQIKEMSKDHIKTDNLIIGYHGNKVHLENMHSRVTEALNDLSEEYKLELMLVYNINDLGKHEKIHRQLSNRIQISHVQWTPECYNEHLSKADIGIIPAFLSIDIKKGLKYSKLGSSFFADKKEAIYNYTEDDYLIR